MGTQTSPQLGCRKQEGVARHFTSVRDPHKEEEDPHLTTVMEPTVDPK